MSPQSIKVYQVNKTQSVEILFADVYRLLHTVYRTFGVVGLCDSFATENIIDLSYADHIVSCIFQCI